MAIKIFAILLALFSIVFTLIGLQDPYTSSFNNLNINFKNISAKKLNMSELNATHVKAHYSASSWVRFKDKDEFENFKSRGLDYKISSNLLTSFNANEYIFSGNVSYTNLANHNLSGDEFIYFKDEKILRSNQNFKAYSDENLINGASFVYDLDKKTLMINGAKAWIRE